ncbi:vWA domain-containing protein [Shewanella metallivivens]|uniref:VWA domain-containing protein n=2 Tax=Shewanella TaxID=22 RepID=A0ABT5TKY5_9GAMM|nr:VWA domain-containing protein [Shewanella metallivivens]MDD8059262.1 VWA domain-containing protein [Shewanella metallivivens]
MMVHLIRPEWLFALLPVALISLLFWRRHSQQSAWKQYIAPHLSQLLITQTADNKSQPKWLLIACWIIAVFALAGPAVNKQNLPVFVTEQGRVLIMDMSLSMYATDLSPNRLSYARFRATDLLSELKEGETGLIAYAGDAYTISPLTRDTATILNLLPTLSPEIMPTKGSNLASALTLAEKLLAQGGHVRGDIILMTDGVSDTQFNQAAKALKDSRYRLSIMAFGSQQGAPIRLDDGQLLRDNSNEVVVAKTDYALLQKLAQQHQGILVPAQTDGSDVKTLTEWLANDGEATETELAGESWQDLGPYLAMILVLPMLLSFRQGLMTLMLNPLFLLGALMGLNAVTSQPAHASLWQDLWQTQDQQAQSAFEQGDFTQAADKFKDPLWQASAHYKAGDYQQALEGFEQDNSANGLYNQGNALMQLNDYQAAIKRYQQALELQSPFTEAQKNLELAKQLLEQQQQSEQSSNQDQSGDGEQSNDPNSNSDQKNQDNNSSPSDQSQTEQNSEQQDNQQRGQQSQDQSKSDQQNQPSSGQDKTSEQNSLADNESEAQQEQQQSSSEQDNEPQNKQQQSATNADENADTEQQSSQSGQSPNDNDEPLSNEASMQAAAEAAEEQANQQPPQMSAGASPAATEQPQGEPSEMVSATQINQDDLPADMQRALRAVTEDPQVLIRNKMQLEYQKRRQNSQPTKDNEQW